MQACHPWCLKIFRIHIRYLTLESDRVSVPHGSNLALLDSDPHWQYRFTLTEILKRLLVRLNVKCLLLIWLQSPVRIRILTEVNYRIRIRIEISYGSKYWKAIDPWVEKCVRLQKKRLGDKFFSVNNHITSFLYQTYLAVKTIVVDPDYPFGIWIQIL